MTIEDCTDEHIGWMREQLIIGCKGGCFGSTNTPTYWEAEEVFETYMRYYPNDPIPAFATNQ